MKITNIHQLPQSLVNAIVNDTYQGPRNNELNRLGVTTLNGPARIYWLKKRHWEDIEEDVSERLWSLLGQSIHSVLERAEDSKSIKEERIEEVIDGITISGQIDVLQDSKIEDWKTTSVWQIVFNPKGKKEWEQQLNVYRWLAHKRGFDIKELIVNAILRDHQQSKAKADSTYPQIPFISIPISLWTIEQAEAYIKERVRAFKAASDCDDNQLPLCTPDEMWEKAGVWAVMKEGRKSAVKLCDTEQAAKDNCAASCSIVFRQGKRNRCEDYCAVNKFCSQYLEYTEGV